MRYWDVNDTADPCVRDWWVFDFDEAWGEIALRGVLWHLEMEKHQGRGARFKDEVVQVLALGGRYHKIRITVEDPDEWEGVEQKVNKAFADYFRGRREARGKLVLTATG